jgi:hypothetical protein
MNKKTANRIKSLLPNGLPKCVRCYDAGPDGPADRFTVVYTGKYRTLGTKRGEARTLGWFQHVGMSASPFHPQGVGMHGEHPQQIDVNEWGFAPAMGRKNHLGRRIPFGQLPADCQTLVRSDYRNIWGLPSPLETLTAKLHPSRFTAMSPKMGSIVAYILGQEWVKPQVNCLMVTSDNFVMGQVKGDIGMNHFIGTESDLARNWKELLDCAGLGHDERALAVKLYADKVRHC